MPPIIKHSGKGKTVGTVKNISGCQELREEVMNKQSTKIFLEHEIIIYTIMLNTCHYIFSKLIKCATSRLNPNVNYEL